MKKIIISSMTLFFLFPILSANALGKRSSSSSQSQCLSAVVEGTAIDSHCSTHTITCPRVALKDSSLDQRCREVTTLCSRYDDTPPPACVYISQPEPAVQTVQEEAPSKPVALGGFTKMLPRPKLGEKLPPNRCHISNGEKRCTSCSDSGYGGTIGISKNTIKGVRTETNKSCRTCTTTIEPLVPKKACNNNDDCVLVKSDCCSGDCKPVAVHKVQPDKYLVRLQKECAPPTRKEGEPYAISGCECATSNPPPQYSAYCSANDGDNPKYGLKFCRVGVGFGLRPAPVPNIPEPTRRSGSLQ